MEFPIVRWDPIILPNGFGPYPSITFTPNDDVIGIAKQNGQVAIRIQGCGNSYENKVCYAALQPASITGGFRPNYQALTGFWCLVPQLAWNGYPEQLGSFVVLDDRTSGA